MYRGYAIIEQKWVYGYLFVAEDKKHKKQYQILQPDYLIGLSKMYVVKPDSIEKYINYNDNQGKEIYENDVLIATLDSSTIKDHTDFQGFYVPETRQYAGAAVIHLGMACLKLNKNDCPAIERILAENTENMYIPLYQIDELYLTTNVNKINTMEEL